MILSAVAVVLAAGALVAALAVPGPVGPQGPAGTGGANGTNGTDGARGPPGPTGSGTLMTSMAGGLLALSSTCTNERPALNLTVPSKGNVTFTASVLVGIAHTSGTPDEVDVYVSLPAPFGNCYLPSGVAVVPASASTDLYEISVPVATSWPVTAAGFESYAIAGIQSSASAASNAAFSAVSGYAVFYPG